VDAVVISIEGLWEVLGRGSARQIEVHATQISSTKLVDSQPCAALSGGHFLVLGTPGLVAFWKFARATRRLGPVVYVGGGMPPRLR
jgi:hypothetical protein